MKDSGAETTRGFESVYDFLKRVFQPHSVGRCDCETLLPHSRSITRFTKPIILVELYMQTPCLA